MRLLFIIMVSLLVFTGCPTVQVKTHNVEHINVVDTDSGKTYDITCTNDAEFSSAGEKKGLVTDNKCVFFITTEKGTYNCEIAVGSDGKPITENTTISESCEMDIKK